MFDKSATAVFVWSTSTELSAATTFIGSLSSMAAVDVVTGPGAVTGPGVVTGSGTVVLLATMRPVVAEPLLLGSQLRPFVVDWLV